MSYERYARKKPAEMDAAAKSTSQKTRRGARGLRMLLSDGMLGEAGLAAVGGPAEVEAGGAELGVGLELVCDVRGRRSGDVVAVQLDGAGAVGAAELCVVVDEGFGDRLELPEGLVTTARLEAAAFDLALVDFF